jgi:glycosyltransferase involved in cell wall biosynthesis
MKIVHAIFSEQFYGSERHCIELATMQAARGHDVVILVRGADSSCARRFGAMIAAEQLGGPAGSGTIRLVAIPRWVPAVLQRPLAHVVLKRSKPDIVHTHLNTATRRVGAVAQRIGVPNIATLHIRYDAREYRQCDGLICYASWQQAAIEPDYRGKATTIWAWPSVQVHEALRRITPQDVEDLRREWHADERTIVFGSIGRLVPEKGMDILVKAFGAAFARGDEAVRLVIVGDGTDAAALSAAKADPRIVFTGARADVALCYRAFDVYVSAARFEPFGLTILEAMDANCPLVVTRTEGPREFLKDARVLWADPDDVATLTQQLSTAAGRGRERITYDLTPFSRAAATQAIEDFYGLVMRGAA